MFSIKKEIKKILSLVGQKNPELLVKTRYWFRFHRRLNLNAPSDLNEKIQYLSLRTNTDEWSRLTDKFAVREYVAQCGLGNILNTLYGTWERAEDVDFDSLPNRFVLKTTHGSGDSIIVHDKRTIDVEKIRSTLRQTLSETYGLAEGDIHYSRITPRVVAEHLLDNDEESSRYSSSLIDYKIWCFDGKAHFIWACTNRTKESVRVMVYDKEWNAHPEYVVATHHYKIANLLPQPKNLPEMLTVAERLAKPFPVVRVDLYNISGVIYFGEMTFTSIGGLMNVYSREFLDMTGKLISIPSSADELHLSSENKKT